MNDTPKIAVPFDFDPVSGYLLNAHYVRAIHLAGGQVIPVIYEKNRITEILDKVDGLLIPGGLGDIDPKLYGQKKNHKRVRIIRERCDFEYPLLEQALSKKIPLFAICWGFQMLNVVFGGTLIQHIPADRPSDVIHEHPKPGIASHHWVLFEQHEYPKPAEVAKHWVMLEDEGEAIKMFGQKKIYVNSTHHQAIDRLASDLILEGKAEDELPECFRIKDYPFGFGVQWHPERLPEDKAIPEFVRACAKLKL